MRKIGAFISYQKLHFDERIHMWSEHTPLTRLSTQMDLRITLNFHVYTQEEVRLSLPVNILMIHLNLNLTYSLRRCYESLLDPTPLLQHGPSTAFGGGVKLYEIGIDRLNFIHNFFFPCTLHCLNLKKPLYLLKHVLSCPVLWKEKDPSFDIYASNLL